LSDFELKLKVETMTRKFPSTRLRADVIAIAALLGAVGSVITPAHAGFDIPTGMPRSPLFGASETQFTQKLLMFEEFGLEPMPTAEATPDTLLPAPVTTADDPNGCWTTPDGAQLDAFLAKGPFPLPGEESDSYSLTGGHVNPWDAQVKNCLPGVVSTVMDARPPGKWFAHQRWNEFKPTVYFQTAMTGSRANGGLRNTKQLHGYSKGEFGPGGLYYNTVFSFNDPNLNPAFNGSTAGIGIRIHPKMPVQDPKSVWTFDGTLPPKLLMARYGDPLLLRHHNALPIDFGANNGFGANTISTHEHNGHNPGESDGFAHAYSYPGQYFDYRWPMILAGHDYINKSALDPRAGTPDGQGGIRNIPGDPGELQSTLWFHDHMLDYTAQNVYKGNAAMMNLYSSVDRGREPVSAAEAATGAAGYRCHYADQTSANLCLPSGSGLDWGNRDYDINLVVADKAWNAQGQLAFNIFNTDGFLGDRMTVNWQYKPYLDVRARRYRFRILNGAVSRYMKIALVDDKGARVPFHLIANDGNIMEHAVAFPNSQSQELPTQAIAERYDIVVDLKNYKGRKLYFVNLMEHNTGIRPNRAIPLADVLSGKYRADGNNGDPAVGKFMEVRVHALPSGQTDLSMNPANYVEGKLKMVPRPRFAADELKNAKHRTFEFGKSSGTDGKPWTIKTDGGAGLGADEHRVSAAPEEGSTEIWHIKSSSGGWSHPVHIHFEEGQILYRGGKAPPVWEKWARKDVYRVGPEPDSTGTVDVAIRVRDFAGTYVEHCHNTTHEDRAMLLRWDSQHSGIDTERGTDEQRNAQNLLAIPTPMMDWNGAWYEPETTYTLPTYKIGDTSAAKSFVVPKLP
jgi:FtsP/CotA-like multicopper oxidase with cupredoxin domain